MTLARVLRHITNDNQQTREVRDILTREYKLCDVKII